jgi:hypothetical protein
MICSTYRAQFASAVETVDGQLELDRFTIETTALAHCGRRSNLEREYNIKWARALSVPMYLSLKTRPLCPIL